MKIHGSIGLQLLTCLLVYVTQVHSIMVKFGTRKGPILAPEPTRTPPPSRQLDLFVPAPVWENRDDDTPDPNKAWRLPLFQPHQPRYTEVVIPNSGLQINHPIKANIQPQNHAQKIANSYKSLKIQEPYILSSQNVPGVGLSYFMPAYPVPKDTRYQYRIPNEEKTSEEESNLNGIEVQDVADTQRHEVYHWHPEKHVQAPTLSSVTYIKPALKAYKYVPLPYVESKQFRKYSDY